MTHVTLHCRLMVAVVSDGAARLPLLLPTSQLSSRSCSNPFPRALSFPINHRSCPQLLWHWTVRVSYFHKCLTTQKTIWSHCPSKCRSRMRTLSPLSLGLDMTGGNTVLESGFLGSCLGPTPPDRATGRRTGLPPLGLSFPASLAGNQ